MTPLLMNTVPFPYTPSRLPACVGLAAWLAASLAPYPLFAQTTAADFADLSLEELMNETVTSVSKREQRLSDAASAVTVLSNDEIRRSGATTIADALRLVPGVNVAAVNSREVAVSVRGFNNLFSNKLLVLVDGRAVYSPVFSGVFWDLQQTMLEDVDRIEVIRGPGATVWGANAVNGVINIITRGAKDTQGGLLYGSTGDVNETNSGMRYGGRLGERTYYRIHAGYQSSDDYPLANGQSADDGWQSKQGGVRIDHHPDDDTQLTWLAGATGVEATTDRNRNIHMLARLTRRWSDRSSFEIQTYYDHTHRDEVNRARGDANTLDFSAQHTFGIGERNDVIWGLGYRFNDISVRETTPLVAVRDGERQDQLFSLFLQNELRLVPDKFTLTAGVKLEHNDYTGVEVQPSIRGVFKPTERQTLWAAVSRAVRTPGSLEGSDMFAIVFGDPFPGPGGVFLPLVVGNPEISSEVLWAHELGWRIQPTRRISVDVAVFYNVYRDLISAGDVSQFIPGVPVGTAEIPFANTLEGETYGGEVSVTASPSDAWRLTASYSLLLADIRGPASANPDTVEDSAPRHQATLGVSHQFNRHLSADGWIRYVDTIRAVPSYITADLRIAWQIDDRLELSLVGRNLLDDRHPEQGATFFATLSEVPRSFYGKLTWRF